MLCTVGVVEDFVRVDHRDLAFDRFVAAPIRRAGGDDGVEVLFEVVLIVALPARERDAEQAADAADVAVDAGAEVEGDPFEFHVDLRAGLDAEGRQIDGDVAFAEVGDVGVGGGERVFGIVVVGEFGAADIDAVDLQLPASSPRSLASSIRQEVGAGGQRELCRCRSLPRFPPRREASCRRRRHSSSGRMCPRRRRRS